MLENVGPGSRVLHPAVSSPVPALGVRASALRNRAGVRLRIAARLDKLKDACRAGEKNVKKMLEIVTNC